MIPYKLSQTLDVLKGPTKEQIIVQNQWAITALEHYHKGAQVNFEFQIDGIPFSSKITWNNSFSKVAMKERKDMANHGGVAIAMFVMSVLLGYSYVEQTEIGDGVDYNFMKDEPSENELNFLNRGHYVEVSGIMEELQSNTLSTRLKEKHRQINKGAKRMENSSVIVTLFRQPKAVKEVHL